MFAAASLAATPLCDGGENTALGADFTLTHTMTIAFTRGSAAPPLTPSSPGGITITPGGTWLVSADPSNINVSP